MRNVPQSLLLGEVRKALPIIKRREIYEKKFKGQKSNSDRAGVRYGNVTCSMR